jgi:hypothetical protein
MERKNRSARTIESYRDHVERIFRDWLDTPLKQLGDDPGQVSAKHDTISEENGPYIANGSMRTSRAIYNHARKTNRELPADDPVDSVDWNHEKRRDTGIPPYRLLEHRGGTLASSPPVLIGLSLVKQRLGPHCGVVLALLPFDEMARSQWQRKGDT